MVAILTSCHTTTNIIVPLTSTYNELPPALFVPTKPAPAPAPKLLAWNAPLAQSLGLVSIAPTDDQRAQLFSGNRLPADTNPISQAYAGHQFGQFVPQLGDGRAVLLGEASGDDNTRHDIQLKGAGRTPFSRGGDGRSALGPVIREYLVSEAMHMLGVPTTRALAAVITGEPVLRETLLPGAILTRVASSHLRIGSFEFLAARNDISSLKQLAHYANARHYPQNIDSPSPCIELFRSVVAAQAKLVAQWMSLGFIHGVMNTDNMTISGETIDYGPCAFMDEYEANKVFSSIDRRGRYAYDQQPAVAQWNLARLAECLLLLVDDIAAFQSALAEFETLYQQHYLYWMTRKLGLPNVESGDEALVGRWLAHLERHSLDFSVSFRGLADRVGAEDTPKYGDVELEWRARLAGSGANENQARQQIESTNPLVIPRNHQIENAIEAAINEDYSVFNRLHSALAAPFASKPETSEFALPPTEEQRVSATFCGT